MKPRMSTRAVTVRILILIVIISTGILIFQRNYFSANEIRNILLISIDTCRADYLSCYGYPVQTTPNIDKLAQEGILFSNAYTPAPLTLPAHSSMFTGTIPPYHGVHDNGNRLNQSNVTIAEMMGRKGFTTAAFISSFVLHSAFGLNKGFDCYNERLEKSSPVFAGTDQRKAEDTNSDAFDWLNKHKSERFFLFLHYYDPHFKYDPPEPYASKFQYNLYAGEIAYVDHCIGQVIMKLKDLDLYDSTLVIITSDHGEMLGEHKEDTHGYFVYQSAVKIPLIFSFSDNLKAKKIDEHVGLIDIVPTICSIFGMDVPNQIQGVDLSGYFGEKKQGVTDRHLYFESLTPTKYNANPLLGLVANAWKYIQTTRPELYNLVENPSETNNLIQKQPHRARFLKDRLKQTLEESVRVENSNSGSELSDEHRKRLESLGYLATTTVTEDFDFDQNKEDPKDLIDFFAQEMKVRPLIRRKKYTQAKIIVEKMIAERPQNFVPYELLAEICQEQADYTETIHYLYEALRLQPDNSATFTNMYVARLHKNLAYALQHQGNIDEAARHFSDALEMNPEDAEVHYNLGNILIRLSRTTEAISHYSEALRINPRLAEAHNNLAGILLNQGRFKEAINHYSEALRLNPTDAEIHNNLGFIMARQSRVAEAIRHYTEALRINPGFAEAHNGLGVVLANQGRIPEAISHFSEAVRINPHDAKAQNNLKNALSAQSRQ